MVFIAEIVPKQIVATTARLLYGENYICLPMKHRVFTGHAKKSAEYRWKIKNRWCTLTAEALGTPAQPEEGSLEQFITEHYWGYSTQRGGGSLEYHVSHAPWQAWETNAAGFEGDASALYGAELGRILQRRPESAFIADGSSVIVFKSRKSVLGKP